MSYRWIEHTAELELELRAPTEAAIFEEALLALAELLTDEPLTHGEHQIELTLTGHDRALLLADWLDELVFRAETEQLVPQSVLSLELTDTGLAAVVSAQRAEPRPLVKGVTHHRLTFTQNDQEFCAASVLDV